MQVSVIELARFSRNSVLLPSCLPIPPRHLPLSPTTASLDEYDGRRDQNGVLQREVFLEWTHEVPGMARVTFLYTDGSATQPVDDLAGARRS